MRAATYLVVPRSEVRECEERTGATHACVCAIRCSSRIGVRSEAYTAVKKLSGRPACHDVLPHQRYLVPQMQRSLLFFVLFSLALGNVCSAQSRSQTSERPRLEATARQGPIEIDGRLNDNAWARASMAEEFVQGEPTEGASPAQPTRVRILYDDETLYVGAHLVEPDPSTIRDQLVRRDQGGQYDYFTFMVDPNLDRQTGYLFRVGAAGNERDAFLFDDTNRDVDFDAVWASDVHRDSTGWSVEMRIPLSQIQYERSDSTQTWGVNFKRRRLASDSESYFALVSRTVEGRVSQFGYLEGIDLQGSGRYLELEPFVAPEFLQAPSDPRNPFFDGTETDFSSVGLDLSYGLSPSFTLDATFNPSFGQTEVDPTVVNLSAFETFFSEKRPFFIQEARIFDFSLQGRRSELFFTRRIGRQNLQGEPPEGADFVDVPDRNTILGASKVTGRTEGGLSVGVLTSVTQEETGEAYFEDRDETVEFVAQPRAETGVVRLSQDLRGGDSRVGVIGTGMNRELPGDGSLDELTDQAFSMGADFEHNWGGSNNRKWELSGRWAGTLIRGSEEAITEVQTNSQHFFQRPDADYLSVDSSATSMFGQQWQLEFGRQSAEHLTWDIFFAEVTPDFAANDLGFNTLDERLDAGGFVRYQDVTPGDWFQEWSVRLFTFQSFRHSLTDDIFDGGVWGRARKSSTISLGANFEFHNNWELELGTNIDPPTLSNAETRGGPLMEDPASYAFSVEVETDPRKKLSVEPEVRLSTRGQEAGSGIQTEMNVTYRPSPRWEFALEPSFSVETDEAQFVASTDDVGFAPTFGERHLFATLEQKEFSLNTRVEAAFTPDLSLQVFAQPLISANDFDRYKQLRRPESFDFIRFPNGRAVSGGNGGVTCRDGRTCVQDGERFIDFQGDGSTDFSFRDQDFNLRSLVGQLVLRWEYMSGSTLFFVWREDRAERARRGDLDLGSDIGGIFGTGAQDQFIVKLQHFFDF
jgi:hypothetical protein